MQQFSVTEFHNLALLDPREVLKDEAVVVATSAEKWMLLRVQEFVLEKGMLEKTTSKKDVITTVIELRRRAKIPPSQSITTSTPNASAASAMMA